MSKTFDLIVSVQHQDGIERTKGHRARFSTATNRDKAASHAIGTCEAAPACAGGGVAIVIGPDADGATLVLSWDDVQSIHLRTEDPPKPPVAVEFEGKDYVPVEDVSGAKVLWPAAWFGAKRKEEPPAAAVN